MTVHDDMEILLVLWYHIYGSLWIASKKLTDIIILFQRIYYLSISLTGLPCRRNRQWFWCLWSELPQVPSFFSMSEWSKTLNWNFLFEVLLVRKSFIWIFVPSICICFSCGPVSHERKGPNELKKVSEIK